MLTLVNRFPALAMILVSPHVGPQLAIIGGDHAAFAARGHDLVLAERPGGDMTDGADRTAFVMSSMSLGAIFDHLQVMLSRQIHDRIHVTWPSSQMNTNEGFGTGRQHCTNGFSSEVLRVKVDICKYRHSPSINNA